MSDQPLPDQSGPMRGRQPATLRGLRASFLPDLIYTIAGPFVIYRLLSPNMPATYALLLAGLLPAARTVIGLLRHRRLNPLGTLSLLTIALNIFGGLVLKDTRLQLLSGSLVTGVYGLLALVSLFTQEPLVARLAAYLLAGTPPEQRDYIKRRWQSVEARSLFRLITAIWGVGLLFELGIRVVLIYTLTVEQVLVISPILRYGFLGGMLLGTLLLTRKRRAIWQKTLEEAHVQQARETSQMPISH